MDQIICEVEDCINNIDGECAASESVTIQDMGSCIEVACDYQEEEEE